ncbi:MAG: CDP-alcohol phosphatidyltransferase family protein [Dermatophilaceae bacterium]|nr:CDP-alcohol phosphatidyltransferase family protein [Intrasporangiaceae bacterium]
MFDAPLRQALEPALDRVARWLDRPWVTPDRITLLGLGLGLASAASAAAAWWWPALLLWWASRICDGLDGPLARRRRRRAPASARQSEAGGFLDITADFVVYGATVVGVAVGATTSHGQPWWPFLLVLLAYYVNGAAFLAFSSIAERTGRRLDDGRSLSFLGGLAEGTETIVVHSLWLLLPMWSGTIAWVWATVVAVSATHRVVAGYRTLS